MLAQGKTVCPSPQTTLSTFFIPQELRVIDNSSYVCTCGPLHFVHPTYIELHWRHLALLDQGSNGAIIAISEILKSTIAIKWHRLMTPLIALWPFYLFFGYLTLLDVLKLYPVDHYILVQGIIASNIIFWGQWNFATTFRVFRNSIKY